MSKTKDNTRTCRICGSPIHGGFHSVRRKGATNYYCTDCVRELMPKGGRKK